jgi:antitoxin component of RelBE/YafQ-DinJ toxin-antitoxin module
MAKARRQTKRSGRISLYVSPELHTELAYLAEQLGLDMNGLIRLMITRSISHYRMEAELLRQQAEENLNLLEAWRANNPGKPIREFWDEYWQYHSGKKQRLAFKAFAGFDFDREDETTKKATSGQTKAPEDDLP